MKENRQLQYTLENLGCANCAAKMEAKINALECVESAVISFPTKRLNVTLSGEQPKDFIKKLQEICAGIESDVVVKAYIDMPVRKKESVFKEHKRAFWELGLGVLFFIIGIVFKENNVLVSTAGFVISYLCLGWEIVLSAVKNIAKGQIFDENFLMSLATIAAFVIGEYAEAVGVMLFYRVGELFEDIAVEKSRSQIMEAIDMRPEVVQVVIGEEVKEIPAGEVKVGDYVLVRPGDRIPLDGRVEEGESRIDTSPVTGEPVPVKVQKGEAVISGCVNISGVLEVVVEKELKDSMVTRILNSVENAAARKPKIDKFITKFSKVYTPFAVAMAILTAIIPSLITGDWNKWIYTAITFLVISCPCALVLSVPLAFFSGIGAGAKLGILFKGGASLEALKMVKAVVMDKTGTITKGNFIVQKIVPIHQMSEKELLEIAAQCELDSTHPIGSSIVEAAKNKKISLKRAIEITEFSGKGIAAVTEKGKVLCGNKELMKSNRIELEEAEKIEYGTEVYIAVNGRLEGYLIISDTIKEEAKEAIAAIHKKGIVSAMLTGDTKESAETIGRKVGIDEVYAKLLPEQKVEMLAQIRKAHGAVMFVGDGINDAPVLAGADAGAAMGSGADAAIEAADIVFMTSSVKAIPISLDIAKKTNKIAMQNVVFALAVKAFVMVLGFVGYADMWLSVFADSGVAMICVFNAVRILLGNKFE